VPSAQCPQPAARSFRSIIVEDAPCTFICCQISLRGPPNNRPLLAPGRKLHVVAPRAVIGLRNLAGTWQLPFVAPPGNSPTLILGHSLCFVRADRDACVFSKHCSLNLMGNRAAVGTAPPMKRLAVKESLNCVSVGSVCLGWVICIECARVSIVIDNSLAADCTAIRFRRSGRRDTTSYLQLYNDCQPHGYRYCGRHGRIKGMLETHARMMRYTAYAGSNGALAWGRAAAYFMRVQLSVLATSRIFGEQRTRCTTRLRVYLHIHLLSGSKTRISRVGVIGQEISVCNTSQVF